MLGSKFGIYCVLMVLGCSLTLEIVDAFIQNDKEMCS